jgi:hypothetical protein
MKWVGGVIWGVSIAGVVLWVKDGNIGIGEECEDQCLCLCGVDLTRLLLLLRLQIHS